MVDQSRIAAIFNDFMSLYLGRSGTGIEQLCKKHDYHRMLMGLLSNLDEAAKVPVPQVMKECYEVYKRYRNLEMKKADWEAIVEETRKLSEKWKSNKWCNRILVELIGLLEEDEAERRRIAHEVEQEMKEMEAVMQRQAKAA